MTEKRLQELYYKVINETKVAVSKEITAFVDLFSESIIKYPNIPIENLYIKAAKESKITNAIADTIQGGIIKQTAIAYNIYPVFSVSVIGKNSTKKLINIFGKQQGKTLSKSVYNSVIDAQKSTYNLIIENANLNKTWKDTSDDLVKVLRGNLKGYENIPKYLKELESIANKAIDEPELFIETLKKARLKVSRLSENRALKNGYTTTLNQIEKAVLKGDQVLLEKSFNYAIKNKLQSLSNRAIITEQSRVFSEGRYEDNYNDPLIGGFNVVLSPAHKIYDVCDILVANNPYPKNRVPRVPAHPNSRTIIEPIGKDKINSKDKGASNTELTQQAKDAELPPSQQKVFEENGYMSLEKPIDKNALTNYIK